MPIVAPYLVEIAVMALTDATVTVSQLKIDRDSPNSLPLMSYDSGTISNVAYLQILKEHKRKKIKGEDE